MLFMTYTGTYAQIIRDYLSDFRKVTWEGNPTVERAIDYLYFNKEKTVAQMKNIEKHINDTGDEVKVPMMCYRAMKTIFTILASDFDQVVSSDYNPVEDIRETITRYGDYSEPDFRDILNSYALDEALEHELAHGAMELENHTEDFLRSAAILMIAERDVPEYGVTLDALMDYLILQHSSYAWHG